MKFKEHCYRLDGFSNTELIFSDMAIVKLHSLLGLEVPPSNGLAWHDLISAGFATASLEALAAFLKVSSTELAALLLFEQENYPEKLPAGVSNTLYRVAKSLRDLQAINGGDVEKGAEWLLAPQDTLKGRVPLTLLTSQVGTDFVAAAISRMKPVTTSQHLWEEDEREYADEA